jgi:hypothetical protein
LAYEGAVGGLEVFYPPALAVRRELSLAAADAGVVAAVDLGRDTATARRAADQQTLLGQRDDGREARRRAGVVTLLYGVPVGSTQRSTTHSAVAAGAGGVVGAGAADRSSDDAGRGIVPVVKS